MMSWNYTGTMKAAYDEYVTSFLASEPRVSAVNIEAQPFVSFADTLNVRLSAKTPPNVSWINASIGPLYVKSGKLVDLTPAINATLRLRRGRLPRRIAGALEERQPAGRAAVHECRRTSCSTTRTSSPKLACRRRSSCSAQNNWTWESMRETAKTLVDKQAARHGLLLNNNIYTNGFRNLIDIYAPYGAAPWSDDGQTCGFSSPQAVQATQFIWDMVYTDKSLPWPGRAGGLDGRQHRHGAGARQRLRDAGRAAVRLGGRGGARRSERLRAVAGAERHRGLVRTRRTADLAAAFVVHTLTKENAAKFAANTPSARKSLATLDAIQPANKVLNGEQLSRSVIKALNARELQARVQPQQLRARRKGGQPDLRRQDLERGRADSADADRSCAPRSRRCSKQ